MYTYCLFPKQNVTSTQRNVNKNIFPCYCHSGYGLSLLEEALQCNTSSHWPGPYPEWFLLLTQPGWETSARPLANASENLAGRVENRPGRVEFCIDYIRDYTVRASANKFFFPSLAWQLFLRMKQTYFSCHHLLDFSPHIAPYSTPGVSYAL